MQNYHVQSLLISNPRRFGKNTIMASLAHILTARVPAEQIPALAHATKGQIKTVEALKKLAEMAQKKKEPKQNG